MALCELTLETLAESYDWEEVFGEGSGGNCDGAVDGLDGADPSPVSRAMVVEIIAAVNGENDEDEWIGVFRLRDGRFLIASGSCDYTGWDCRAGNHLAVAPTLESAIRYGITEEQRIRLQLT